MEERIVSGEKVIVLSEEEARQDEMMIEKMMKQKKSFSFAVADGELRERCFEAFDKGMTEKDIIATLPESMDRGERASRIQTIKRYYRFWKWLKKNERIKFNQLKGGENV
jgi:hypothetical protein